MIKDPSPARSRGSCCTVTAELGRLSETHAKCSDDIKELFSGLMACLHIIEVAVVALWLCVRVHVCRFSELV